MNVLSVPKLISVLSLLVILTFSQYQYLSSTIQVAQFPFLSSAACFLVWHFSVWKTVDIRRNKYPSVQISSLTVYSSFWEQNGWWNPYIQRKVKSIEGGFFRKTFGCLLRLLDKLFCPLILFRGSLFTLHPPEVTYIPVGCCTWGFNSRPCPWIPIPSRSTLGWVGWLCGPDLTHRLHLWHPHAWRITVTGGKACLILGRRGSDEGKDLFSWVG